MLRSHIVLLGQFVVGLTLMAFTGPALAEEPAPPAPWWVWVLVVLVLLLLLLWWWLSSHPQEQEQEELLVQAESAEEPEEEPEPEPAPEPEPVAPLEPDDLRRIEGIGPKISALLQEAGIATFAQLAATDVGRLREILDAAPFRAPADPSTWPEQAALAAQGDWEALARLQDELKGGRRV